MNTIVIITVLITGFLITCAGLALFFTRRGKNILNSIARYDKYVVCHLKNKNTDFEEIWKVVPTIDFLTTVGKHNYNLNPKYSLLKWKGRLHYSLNESDVIPEYPTRTNLTEEILIQVDETDTAIQNRAYKIIYGKQKDIALILCAFALVLSLLTSIYVIYSIDNMTSTIQTVYNSVQPALSNYSIVR